MINTNTEINPLKEKIDAIFNYEFIDPIDTILDNIENDLENNRSIGFDEFGRNTSLEYLIRKFNKRFKGKLKMVFNCLDKEVAIEETAN